jgi:hypothetical protein
MIACRAGPGWLGCCPCLVPASRITAARKSAANSAVKPPSTVSIVVSVVTVVLVTVEVTGLGTEVTVEVVKSVSVHADKLVTVCVVT